jgi:hypothetical protein
MPQTFFLAFVAIKAGNFGEYARKMVSLSLNGVSAGNVNND